MTDTTANGPGESGAAGDECPWCRTADPSVGDNCKNCGRPIATTSSAAPTAATPAAQPLPPPPPPPTAAPERPTVVVPVTDPTVLARQSRLSAFRRREVDDEMGPSRTWVMLGWVAVAAATIGVVAIVLMSGDSDGDATPDTLPAVTPTSSVPASATTQPPAVTQAPTSVLTPVPTPIPTTTAPGTIPATTTGATIPPATTIPATTAPVATTPVTTPAPTTVPVTTSPATSAPASPPASGPGSPQVLNDPLPSGVSAQAVAPAFAVAQRLADALAKGDWDTARTIDVDSRQSTDATFETGYGGLDRASLMLLDAKPDGDGYRLLFVSVANELSGARTSLYCLEWSADPDEGLIDQHSGSAGLVARVARTMTPEAVRQDASLDRDLRNECRWSS